MNWFMSKMVILGVVWVIAIHEGGRRYAGIAPLESTTIVELLTWISNWEGLPIVARGICHSRKRPGARAKSLRTRRETIP